VSPKRCLRIGLIKYKIERKAQNVLLVSRLMVVIKLSVKYVQKRKLRINFIKTGVSISKGA
jgi:hypothetical protein